MAFHQAAMESFSGTGAIPAQSKPGPGLLARFYARLIAVQQQRADQMVAAQLKSYSDAQLAEFGFSPERIGEIRRVKGRPPVRF